MDYPNFTGLHGHFVSDWFVVFKCMVIFTFFTFWEFFFVHDMMIHCFIIGSWGHTFIGN